MKNKAGKKERRATYKVSDIITRFILCWKSGTKVYGCTYSDHSPQSNGRRTCVVKVPNQSEATLIIEIYLMSKILF